MKTNVVFQELKPVGRIETEYHVDWTEWENWRDRKDTSDVDAYYLDEETGLWILRQENPGKVTRIQVPSP